MSNRASAARYARALLDVVIKEGNPEQVEQELAAFAEVLDKNPDLQKALTNPAVPVSGKRGIVEGLVSRSTPSAPLGRLLVLLAERDRLSLVPDLLAVYRERLMEHRQIVRAEVTTAEPLPPDRVADLERRLGAVTGRRVVLTTAVKPELIGGAVARVGSTVYDGSIATQLEKVRAQLSEQR
jgi:F-type H+-transporting ATPase subunit delta